MIRCLDFIFSFLGLIFVFPILVIIFVVGTFDAGGALFTQKRLGRDKRLFTIIKFRTMSPNTASVASHLVSSTSLTKFGAFLRKTKLDELPQLWNVLKGEMSLVGPRPGLPNQFALTAAREKLGVFDVRPGCTGLAQVRGVDMSMPGVLATIDAEMIAKMSVKNYFRYIFLTVLGHGQGDKTKP